MIRKRMSKRKYLRYLRSPAWTKKKAAVRARCNNWCERCGNRRMTEVHHLTYERLGNELDTDLLGVCRKCHRVLHNIHGRSAVLKFMAAALFVLICLTLFRHI